MIPSRGITAVAKMMTSAQCKCTCFCLLLFSLPHHLLDSINSPSLSLYSKEFTNKRREILLLNISIKTQQEEIDKLHTDLRAKEASLKAREDSLIKEQKRFDCFLKDLDQSQQSAAAALDEQLKIRKEKEQVVKDLSQEVGIVESGIRQLLADDEK